MASSHPAWWHWSDATVLDDYAMTTTTTGQNAISRQPCEIFIPKFLGLYERYPATILYFYKNNFCFLQSYSYINIILCYIFNSARNNQQQRPKWMLNFMLKPCCRNLFKIADLFCHLASSFNRHTWQSWLKTGLQPTAVNTLVKVNGLRPHLTSTLWTFMSGELGLFLNATSHFNPSRRTSMSSRKFCSWYGTSCHRTWSTKPYWAFRKDFGLVWKLVMDTSNIR